MDIPGKEVSYLGTPMAIVEDKGQDGVLVQWNAIPPLDPAQKDVKVRYRIWGFDAEGNQHLLGTTDKNQITVLHAITDVRDGKSILKPILFVGVDAIEVGQVRAKLAYGDEDAVITRLGAYLGHRSPLSNLARVEGPLPLLPVTGPPVQVKPDLRQVLEWPKVAYQIVIRDKDRPSDPPIVVLSENDYLSADVLSGLPKGLTHYNIQVEEVHGYQVLLIDKAGNVTRVDRDENFINLGDWLNYNTYAVFDGETMELKTFGKE